VSDILEEAETLLVQLPDAVAQRRFGERLGEAVTVLKIADAQIARIQALLKTADLLGYGKVPQQREVIDEMVYWARHVGKSLEEADDSEDLRSAVFDFKDSLHKAIIALERGIHELWRTEAESKFQPLIALGELLCAINVANNLGSRLVQCGKAGLGSTNIGLATERLSTIRKLLADHKTLQDERTNSLGDDEVSEFIKALADNRATLAMVSPKVHAWLSDHDALARLGVTTRSRGSVGATSG
jgi:hypothetical protein